MQPRPTSHAEMAEIREISAIVTRLLAHYWTADEHPRVRQAQLEDWLEDLVEFGPAIVAAACRDYRQSGAAHRRPIPIDIRRLCIETQRGLAEQKTLTDEHNKRWPTWLEDIWGPEPDGPIKRAAALVEQSRERQTFNG